MAALPSESNDPFFRDLCAVTEEVRQGVVPSTAKAAQAHWTIWENFCDDIGLDDPTLQSVDDPIPFLQVFAYRFRHGHINKTRRPVRSRTVEGALRSIGQAASAVGSPDPRYNSHGKIDFRLQRLLAAYKRKDPPPNRVKPCPVPLLLHIMAAAAVAAATFKMRAIADMICLAFFYLLRPGEYSGHPDQESTPFRLMDTVFYIGAQRLNTSTATDAQLNSATFVTLEFTTQKNGVAGEVIGHGLSGNPTFCPVRAAARRVIHLRAHGAPPDQPLASFYNEATHKWNRLCPADITNELRLAAAVLGPALGFLPKHVSARSLRASGAMALLCANVDTDKIRLIGRWRSDEMLRYLHVQADRVMQHFSSRMLSGGHFSLLPNHEVPLL